MSQQFKLPDLGEGVHEGQVIKLLVAEGETVEEDQPLMEVETDKAAVEIPSPFAGRIEKWHVEEKQLVNVGDLMVTVTGTETVHASASSKKTHTTAARGSASAVPRSGSSRKPASPAVRKLARQLGVDLDQVDGSGPGGRVSREDVERAAKGAQSSPSISGNGATVVAKPQTIRNAPSTVKPVESGASEPGGTDDRDEWGAVRRAPITQLRKTVATVMTQAASTIPHVTDTDDADVTDLDRLRRGYNEPLPKKDHLGMLAFVVRAVARALQMHPIFNASFDASKGEIIYKRYYNIAIGVQTERGLVAPVIRDVDRLSVPEINAELARLVERVRQSQFDLADTRGGTYTISNAGAMGGSRYSTPIITPPQVAVLAVGRSRMMPWVVNDAIEPRLIMPFSHSMDHRLIDGALEIAFLRQIIGDLENPGRLLL